MSVKERFESRRKRRRNGEWNWKRAKGNRCLRTSIALSLAPIASFNAWE